VLNQSKRISPRSQVESALQSEDKIRTPFFILFKEENALPLDRYAVIAPKKIWKLSTGRNALRRKFYELIRLHEKSATANAATTATATALPAQKHYDRVLMAGHKAVHASRQELSDSISKYLT
jgi:ribonuclease P protein component